jgi:hypothetical protein
MVFGRLCIEPKSSVIIIAIDYEQREWSKAELTFSLPTAAVLQQHFYLTACFQFRAF